MDSDQDSAGTTPRRAKRTMKSWLADECREAREEASVSIETIASIAGISYSKLYKFEQYADRWPREIDLLLAAYAKAIGISDHRLLWLRALDRWFVSGQPLVLVDGEIQDGEGVVPIAALKGMEEAIGAYVHGLAPETSRSAQASSAAGSRPASAKRARP
jgi:hypothetical protein